MSETIFSNQTTNTTTAAIPLTKVLQAKDGKYVYRTIFISGTMDGATFTLLADNGTGTYVGITDLAMTTTGVKNLAIKTDNVKGQLSGGGASMNVTVILS